MHASSRQVLSAALLLTVAVAGGPATDAAQRGAKPVNTPANAVKWEPYGPGSELQVAMVWGDRTKSGEYGMMLKMPAGFEAGRHTHTNDYHGVTIQGTWVHTNDGSKPRNLPPGSTVFQPGKQVHNDTCPGKQECIILIRQEGPGDFIPAQ